VSVIIRPKEAVFTLRGAPDQTEEIEVLGQRHTITSGQEYLVPLNMVGN
jgi:hypothetical protein